MVNKTLTTLCREARVYPELTPVCPSSLTTQPLAGYAGSMSLGLCRVVWAEKRCETKLGNLLMYSNRAKKQHLLLVNVLPGTRKEESQGAEPADCCPGPPRKPPCGVWWGICA